MSEFFKKADIARAASASAISLFEKLTSANNFPKKKKKTISLLINNINMKKCV